MIRRVPKADTLEGRAVYRDGHPAADFVVCFSVYSSSEAGIVPERRRFRCFAPILTILCSSYCDLLTYNGQWVVKVIENLIDFSQDFVQPFHKIS